MKNKKQNGYTIIELMIVGGIAITIGIAIAIGIVGIHFLAKLW